MTTTFIGLPVEGEKAWTQRRIEQGPPEEFEAALRALFDHEIIEAVRWVQYTPYFNDGEPCIFNVQEYGGGIKFTDTDDYVSTEDGQDEWLAHVGGEKFNYNGPGYPAVQYVTIEGAHPVAGEAAKAFYKTLLSGRHDHLLQDVFGDHAEITATREKIVIGEYQHD